jgi:hypothetical protein
MLIFVAPGPGAGAVVAATEATGTRAWKGDGAFTYEKGNTNWRRPLYY